MISAMTSKRGPESDNSQEDVDYGEIVPPHVHGPAGSNASERCRDCWHLLLQQSPEPCLIIEDGLFVDCNQAALQFLGLGRKEQLIGRHPCDCSPRAQADGCLSVDKANEILSSAVASGSCRFQWRHMKSDATVIPVEVTLTRLNMDGREVIYTAWQDLSGLDFPQVAVREGDALFREVFEESEDAILLLAPDSWKVVDANPSAARLYGYSRHALRGGGIRLFMEPAEWEQFIEAVRHHHDANGFSLEAVRHITKDRKKLVVAIKCRPITFHFGTLLYCCFRDISDRLRLEQEAKLMETKLIHTNKMTSLGTLVSSVAHEINNPNNFIMLNSSLLKEAWADVVRILEDYAGERGDLKVAGLPFGEMKDAVGRLISGVMDGSRRIDAIVTGLKQFSQPQKTSKGSIDVNTVVQMAASMLSSQIKKYTNRFDLDLDETIPKVWGNTQQLEQVVINLVLNALHALPGRECSVRVVSCFEKETGAVMIRVEDEGTGISSEVLARIKEPFFSTKVDSGGTGLGVYISHSIIKGHNGSLVFQSKEGQGTTAIISLPAAVEDCEMAKEQNGDVG